MKQKWFEKDWGIIFLCGVFFPVFFPVGLYLVWKKSDWTKNNMIIIFTVGVVFWVPIIMTLREPSNTTSNSPSGEKCSDMDSYRGGVGAARENGNMIAECDYYWNDLGAKYTYESKSCFCKGFND